MKTIIFLLKTKYPAILWTITIFILCTLPSNNLPEANDKTAHFVVFALWSFLWLIPTRKVWFVLISGAVFGLLIEFWQAILPENFHRGYDLLDALADAIGGVLGYLIWKVADRFISF
jgi:VanZ family protein